MQCQFSGGLPCHSEWLAEALARNYDKSVEGAVWSLMF